MFPVILFCRRVQLPRGALANAESDANAPVRAALTNLIVVRATTSAVVVSAVLAEVAAAPDYGVWIFVVVLPSLLWRLLVTRSAAAVAVQWPVFVGAAVIGVVAGRPAGTFGNANLKLAVGLALWASSVVAWCVQHVVTRAFVDFWNPACVGALPGCEVPL